MTGCKTQYRFVRGALGRRVLFMKINSLCFFFSSRRRHTRSLCDWSSDVSLPISLPGAPAGFSGIGRVTALDASRRPSPPLRIRGSEPDSLSIGRGQRRPSPVPSERRSPISQDRLTHVQLLFTWKPSPLRPSKFSFEYLLLPPRSAPAAAPPGPAP